MKPSTCESSKPDVVDLKKTYGSHHSKFNKARCKGCLSIVQGGAAPGGLKFLFFCVAAAWMMVVYICSGSTNFSTIISRGLLPSFRQIESKSRAVRDGKYATLLEQQCIEDLSVNERQGRYVLQGREGDRSGAGSDEECPLGRLYVYKVPSDFNCKPLATVKKHLTVQGKSAAMFLHLGMGEPVLSSEFERSVNLDSLFPDPSCWFNTETLPIEPLYHARMLKERCRTSNPDEASIFYIPYYAALGLEPVISKRNVTLNDKIPLAFVEWLKDQPHFQRNGGHDHFLVLGWGDNRYVYNEENQWGSTLLRTEAMQNVTKLVHYRNFWDRSTLGVPYNVFFHPSTDQQLQDWQDHVVRYRRRHLVGFMGSTRRGPAYSFASKTFQFRTKLVEECQAWDRCSFFDCKHTGDETEKPCNHVSTVMGFVLASDFCLQPPGDTWPRKSIFDGMLGGCIPVFFTNNSAYYQYMSYLPQNRSTYSVFIDMKEVEAGKVSVREVLENYSQQEIARMRKVIVNSVIPKIIVANPRDNRLQNVKDAVTLAIEGVMTRVERRRLGLEYATPTPWMWENWPRMSYAVLHDLQDPETY